jgi:YidC/Oxa1 family membrane protein insertase
LNIWDIVILQPMINILIALSNYLANNFGLTVIVLTVIIRILMIPLTMRQLHATRAMSTLQPRLAEIQKKYAKDRQRLAQEQMKLYRESGISPMGCMVPMLVQMPIWIALYQAIMLSLAVTPEGLLNLARYLYHWSMLYPLLPLNSTFLWLDLTRGDMVLAILVGVTMWVQQKMVTATSPDPRMQQQNTMMLWMMPMMFAFLTLSFPSGLALYWVASNIIQIIIQYRVAGWGGLSGMFARRPPVTGEDRYKRRIALEGAQRPSPQPPAEKIPEKGTDTGADVTVSTEPKSETGEGESVSKRLRQMFGSQDKYRTQRHRPKK